MTTSFFQKSLIQKKPVTPPKILIEFLRFWTVQRLIKAWMAGFFLFLTMFSNTSFYFLLQVTNGNLATSRNLKKNEPILEFKCNNCDV